MNLIKVLTLHYWWKWKDPSSVSSNAQATYFAKYTALESLLFGMLRSVQPYGRSESTSWLDSLQDLSASKKVVEDFLDVHFFLHYS